MNLTTKYPLQTTQVERHGGENEYARNIYARHGQYA
jgi:hypothetical protein